MGTLLALSKLARASTTSGGTPRDPASTRLSGIADPVSLNLTSALQNHTAVIPTIDTCKSAGAAAFALCQGCPGR